jgi:hypothetical protein
MAASNYATPAPPPPSFEEPGSFAEPPADDAPSSPNENDIPF